MRFLRRSPNVLPSDDVVGPARIDRRTKNLIPRLHSGDVAVIDHDDVDWVAAEGLVAAQPIAIVNAAPSLTGRYPNLGALVIVRADIPLIDDVGGEFLDLVHEGQPLTVVDNEVFVGGERVARGVRQDSEMLEKKIELARESMSEELESFAQNTLEYLVKDQQILTHATELSEIEHDLSGRHVLIVVRAIEIREDLQALSRIGYMKELRPVLIGVDGGADALIDLGYKPDIILGDFDSVSKDALQTGAELIVHAYPGGEAPGAERLERLGFSDYGVVEAPGTSEDVAMLLAFEHRAELIVAVGSHSSMNEFFDKGRAGMASTFLTRMRVGQILVDAKGVSRLYRNQVRLRDLSLLILSALFTLIVIVIVTEPIRLLIRTVWLNLN